MLSILPRQVRQMSFARTRMVVRHMSNMEPLVTFRSDMASRTFILNRPEKLNALNEEMIDLLIPRIQEWDRGELCKVIIGTGTGRAFCAGGDVETIVRNARQESTRPNAIRFFQKEFELDFLLSSLSKPYVALLDGITMGGGVGLSIHAPFRVATENTLFAMPETKIGYFPDVGASHFLSRLDGEIGTYLALSGGSIKGRAVFQLGLATHFVSSRRIPSLISRLSSLENATPDIIDETLEEYFSEPVLNEPSLTLVGPVRVALDSAFSHNSVEEIVSALESIRSGEENPSVAEWASTTLDEMYLRSPTSLKVALEAIRRGKFMDLREALQMDMRVATAFCAGSTPDFQTGVEAVLVKKSKERPNWTPSSLSEISNEKLIFDFFNPESRFAQSTPTLSLPPWIGNKEPDCMKYALPTEEEIGHFVKGDHSTSASTGLNVLELSGKVEGLRRGKNGVREKVFEVASRRCQVVEQGGFNHLKWIY